MVKEIREAVAKEDDEQIKRVMPELQQALFAVGSNLYQQQGGAEGANPDVGTDAGSAGGGDTSSSGSGDDVIDADFTESK